MPERLHRILSSDLLKIAVLVLMFVWNPLTSIRLASVTDPDLGWHLRTGEWIMQHHQLPHTDLFSATGMGKPWVAYSWSFGVLMYELARNWDLLGIVAFVVGIWIAITMLLFFLVRSLTKDFWTSAVLTFLGSIVMRLLAGPRPGTFTIIFFLLTLALLLRAQKTGNPHLLLPLPVILWVWANIHLQFVYGLFLIGVFCIEPWVNRLFSFRAEDPGVRARWLWTTLGTSTALTFANPYGSGPYWVILDFVRQPLLYFYTFELRAMAFDEKVHFLVLILCLVGAFALGRQRPIRPLWLLLLIWAAVLGFHAQRDLWVITAISLAILAAGRSQVNVPSLPPNPRVWLAATACILLVLIWVFKAGANNKQLISRMASNMPVGAVAYIHEHHLQGPIFNDFDWGGFLIYALPDMPVAIDGRTNVHNQDEIMRSLRTWNLWPAWDNDPLLAKANLVVGRPDRALTIALRYDSPFRPVFDDGVAVLYQRVKPVEAQPAK